MLLDVIAVYLSNLQKKGRAAADAAITGADPVIQRELKKSFDDHGKLINSDGTRVTAFDLMKFGIKSPL